MAKSRRPPTFRGSDFAMRYTQGQWSEERIIESINRSAQFRAIPYGKSQIGPESTDEIAAYWEKYVAAENVGKRPDILVLWREDHQRLLDYLPDDPTTATDEELAPFLNSAICGIEAENSLWVASEMPDYSTPKLTRLNFVAPTIIVKEEDEGELEAWQKYNNIPIFIVQVFYDRAYIIQLDKILGAVQEIKAALSGKRMPPSGIDKLDQKEIRKRAQKLQKELGIFLKEQSFTDSRTGASTKKTIYRAHYSVAEEFGILDPDDPPKARPKVIVEKNGKVMAYVHFEGGSLLLSEATTNLFKRLSQARAQ